jgi:Fuc2NAc and GlcNAc transferase
MSQEILIIGAGVLLLALLLTYLIRLYAIKYRILDIPNERSSHVIPTPRGGGLAIVLSWFIGISILFSFGAIESKLYFALMSGVILAIISLLDDLFTLKPFIRLLIQLITAILAFVFLNGINPVNLLGISFDSKIFLYPFCIIGIIWFINLYNFLDGIDGYASIEAIVMAVLLYVVSGNSVCLIILAATLGFLFWNWPKAKIFMGDIGSTQLGFILVILGIYFHNTTTFSIIHWLLLSSLFWFDATLTLFRRIRKRENLSEAHKKHVYQRAVQSGYSHLQTIIFSVFLNLIIIVLVMTSLKMPYLLFILFLADIFFLYSITRIIDKKVPFK